jgi:hypothetical protein
MLEVIGAGVENKVRGERFAKDISQLDLLNLTKTVGTTYFANVTSQGA